jgi:exodeoxyribonuclease VII small subunit
MSEPNFEDALARLEEIVEELEEGEAELDRTLALFEEGVKLSKLCHKRLEAAEKKIEVLIKKEGGKLGRQVVEGEEDDLDFPQED